MRKAEHPIKLYGKFISHFILSLIQIYLEKIFGPVFVLCVWLVNQTSAVVYAFSKLLIFHVISVHIAGLMQFLVISRHFC